MPPNSKEYGNFLHNVSCFRSSAKYHEQEHHFSSGIKCVYGWKEGVWIPCTLMTGWFSLNMCRSSCLSQQAIPLWAATATSCSEVSGQVPCWLFELLRHGGNLQLLQMESKLGRGAGRKLRPEGEAGGSVPPGLTDMPSARSWGAFPGPVGSHWDYSSGTKWVCLAA